jgi:hypothetical protein
MIWVGYRRSEAAARALLEDSDLVDDLLESDDDDTSVDLDKAWHALHWLLTASGGNPEAALSDVIFGGQGIGEDLGYGPARLLSTDRVQAVAQALAQLEVTSLRSRMDAQAMEAAEVYPMIWDEDDVFDSYLAPAYDRLRDFYSAAATADEAVIQTIC